MGSTSGILPFWVEFELRGVPVHAWEMAAVAQFLNPFA
jgi:hypothetical protein